MKLKILALLWLAIFLNGCVMISSEQKLECARLATIPESSISECASPKECSKKLNESFRLEGFGESTLDEELGEWKNSIAMNWLYYNKARKTLKEIQNSCNSGKVEELPQKTNALEFYLSQSMEFLDSANKHGFASISLQESRLRIEGIEQIREEELFDDFIELNEILNQDRKAESKFLKKHFEANAEMLQTIQETGFNLEFETEVSERDLFNQALPEVLKNIRPSSVMVVLGKKAASAISEYLNQGEKVQNAVQELGRISAARISRVIENYTGLENSTSSEFYLLFKKIQEKDARLAKENSERAENTREILKGTWEKIKEIEEGQHEGLSSEFLTELTQELGLEASIELRKNEFSSVAEFQAQAERKQAGLETSQEAVLRENPKLGEKTKKLKELEKEAIALKKSLEWLESEVIGKTSEYCSAKAVEIGKKAAELKKEKEFFEKAQFLENRALEAKSPSGKKQLSSCWKMLQAYNSLRQEALGQEPKQEKLEIQECMQTVEEAAATMPSIKQGLEMLQRWQELEESEERISIECEKLKEKAIEIAEEKLANAKKEWVQLSSELGILEMLSGTENSFLQKLKKQAKELGENFGESEQARIKGAGISEELEKTVQELREEIKPEMEKEMAKHLMENASIEITGIDGEAVANQEMQARARLEFYSSIEWNNSLELQIELIVLENPVLASSTSSVQAFFDKNSVRLEFQKIEKGKTIIEIEGRAIPASTEEKTENPLTLEERAFFEKKIKIKTVEGIKVQELTVRTKVLPGAENLKAIAEGSIIIPEMQNSEAVFKIPEAKNNQEVVLRFEIPNPLEKTSRLLGEYQEGFGTRQEIELQVRNRLGIELNNLKVSLDMIEGAEQISAMDESYKRKEIEKSPWGEMLLEEKITGFETKKYFLSYLTSQESVNWNEEMLKNEKIAQALTESENAEIAQEAQEIVQELELWKETFSANNSQHKKALYSLFEKTRKLEQKQNTELADEARVQEQIGILEGETAKMLEKIKQSKYAGSLEKANQSLQKAASVKESSPEQALKELQNARAILQKEQETALKAVKEKAKEILELALKDIENAEEQGLDASKEKQELIGMEEKILEEAGNSNLEEAEESLEIMEKNVQGIKARVGEKASERVEKFLNNAQKFEEKNKRIGEMLEKIGKNFQSASLEEMSKLQYLAPITKEELGKLKFQASSLESASLENSIESIKQAMDENELSKALKLVAESEKSLEEKMQKQEQLAGKLEEVFGELKQDAGDELERAKNASANQSSNEKIATLLEKSGEEIGKENFLKSIQYSGYAILLAGNQTGFNLPVLPLSLIPLIMLIGMALWVKKNREKEEKERKERVQRIMRKGLN